MKKVVILGGTFNPVHKTHSYILEQAKIQLFAEEKYYLINNIPPHKKKYTISNHHRLEMLKLQASLDGSKIIDYELHINEISYTYNTIKYLKAKHPCWDIYFLIGQDNVSTLHNWYKIEELKKLVTFVGVKRLNQNNFINNDVKIFIDVIVSDLSSTQIRKQQIHGCEKSVENYIKLHKLYN